MLNTAMFSDGSQATLAMVGVAEHGGDLDVDVVDGPHGVLIGQLTAVTAIGSMS